MQYNFCWSGSAECTSFFAPRSRRTAQLHIRDLAVALREFFDTTAPKRRKSGKLMRHALRITSQVIPNTLPECLVLQAQQLIRHSPLPYVVLFEHN
jgi:hypothetical protein